MTMTDEDLKLIRKFEDISKRGYYASGEEVTNLHNKVLGTRLSSTNCGSCIKQRISALVEAANRFERMMAKEAISSPIESVVEDEVDTSKEKENKAVRKKK